MQLPTKKQIALTEDLFAGKFIEPMSYKDTKKLFDPVFFQEYKHLGGKLSKEEYTVIARMFLWFTYDTFVSGLWLFHGDSKEAMRKFARWLVTYHPTENPETIFKSVDNVHAYT